MIVTSAAMQALEQSAFDEGVTPEALMEDAGRQIALVVDQFFSCPGKCTAFFGKGHNGGDALVAARQLASCGWQVDLRGAFPESEWSELTARKFNEFQELNLSSSSARRGRTEPHIVLDGLLGLGGGGKLRDPVRAAACEINHLRRSENAYVFAIDLPTGLDSDSGDVDDAAVLADFTLTIGFVKRGLLADGATRHTGRLAVLPLEELSSRVDRRREAPDFATTAAELAPLLPRRAFEVHKGDFGRIGIVAGSRGLTGAAILAAEACARAGGGLVSLYVTKTFTRSLPPRLHQR
jgi:NAD(P)H-hydrate epimerase